MQSEKEILAKISQGDFKDFYLCYHRQSTDEAESQKNSLEYQKVENTRFIQREHLRIAPVTILGFCTNGIIAEKNSGFAEDSEIIITEDGNVQFSISRHKFKRLLYFLSKGYFKGIVCLSWDRLSRNKADDALVRKLMRKGVDFRFAYAKYDQSSSGELHMDVDGMFAAHHSRVTREKVTATIRASRDKGLFSSRAPIGYLNQGNMDHKPIDPTRAPVIKRLFELYVTGEWSLSALARWANEQGLSTTPMRPRRTAKEMLQEDINVRDIQKVSRPVTVNNLSRMLSNPFYTGRIKGNNGTLIKSNCHEALIDDKLFNSVQTILEKKNTSIHYVRKLDLPLRGIIRCAQCGRVYTPYTKKGILYFNSRCKVGCENTLRNLNFDYISKMIGQNLKAIFIKDEEIEKMEHQVGTDIALLEEKRQREFEEIERKKRRIREDLVYININRLTLLKTGAYTPEGLVEAEYNLNEDLTKLQLDEQVSDIAMREVLHNVLKLSELVKDLEKTYSFANSLEKEVIIRLMFSELWIFQNTLKIKYKKGFDCLETRKCANCAPSVWLSELIGNTDHITEAINILQQYSSNYKQVK